MWLAHRGGFTAVVREGDAEPGRAKVRVLQTGEIITVDEDDLEKVHRKILAFVIPIKNVTYIHRNLIKLYCVPELYDTKSFIHEFTKLIAEITIVVIKYLRSILALSLTLLFFDFRVCQMCILYVF